MWKKGAEKGLGKKQVFQNSTKPIKIKGMGDRPVAVLPLSLFRGIEDMPALHVTTLMEEVVCLLIPCPLVFMACSTSAEFMGLTVVRALVLFGPQPSPPLTRHQHDP